MTPGTPGTPGVAHRMGLMKTAVVEWNGEPVKRIKKSFAAACKIAGLEGVTPHTLRHTATTWLLQRDVPQEEVAGFIGLTRDMLERVYAHHSPDHQGRAVTALSICRGPAPAIVSIPRKLVLRGR